MVIIYISESQLIKVCNDLDFSSLIRYICEENLDREGQAIIPNS
jgi:hypothetical protein